MLQYGWLLLALFTLLLLSPLLEGEGFLGGWILPLGFSVVYVAGLFSKGPHRLVFKIVFGVAVLVLVLTWTDTATESETIATAHYLASVFYLLMLAVMILLNIFREHIATVNAVLGAMCVYFLLGLAWASLYRSVELIETNPINVAHRDVVRESGDKQITAFSQMIYFSFVTMSTLGYGDISPATPLARTLCWTQAVIGQFYIAVLVAWLVSALPRPPLKHEKESQPETRIK